MKGYYTMNSFTLSIANGTRGEPKNKIYPQQASIASLDALLQATQFDHTAGVFKNNERGNSNFISAEVIMMDCDNDNSEQPSSWLTPTALAERLPDVAFYVVFSKSHMKVKHEGKKDEKSARPRWHVYFPLSESVDKNADIRRLKEQLLVLVPEFDGAAKDAARFFYGVEHPQGEAQEGSLCIDEYLAIADIGGQEQAALASKQDIAGKSDAHLADDISSKDKAANDGEVLAITGERHAILIKTGINLLSQYAEAKARELFDRACEACNPPLPAGGPNGTIRIWDWCLKAHKRTEARIIEKQKKLLTLPIVEHTLQELGISVRYNVITKQIDVSELPADPDFVPPSYASLNSYAKRQVTSQILPDVLLSMFKKANYGVSEHLITNAISAIASTNPCNPVADMLTSQVWDRQDRIAKIYQVLGIYTDEASHELKRDLLRKWLHQAVALALNDDGSINADFVLVLQGAQGLGKTNFFRKLAVNPEWFGEGLNIDMNNKDTIIQATSVWLGELGELDATMKREQASLKAFITANFDTYRKPYARIAERVERRTCFCATVNPEQAIRDDTGSRRYVFIHVDDIDKDFVYSHMTPEWCSQLWRQVYETLYLECGRKAFYLADHERAFVEKANDKFTRPLDAELELMDIFEWGAPYDKWEYRRLSDLLLDKRLMRFSTYKLSRAVRKILTKRNIPLEEHTRLVHGRTEYFLPPALREKLPGFLDDEQTTEE